MATVAEYHGTVNPGPNQVVVHVGNGAHPLPKGAGAPITAATKAVGQPNGTVLGQVSGTSVVLVNPA